MALVKQQLLALKIKKSLYGSINGYNLNIVEYCLSLTQICILKM